MLGIVTKTQAFTEEVLGLYTQRQNIVLSNIANVDTPNYRAKDFNFEDALQECLGGSLQGTLSSTHSAHFPRELAYDTLGGELTYDSEIRTLWGADKVNLEEEMTKLTKINLKYSALAQVVRSGYSGLQQVIQEVK